MKIGNAILIIRYLGLRWIGFRIWKTVSEKLGYWERRVPSSDWQEINDRFGDGTTWEAGRHLTEQLASDGVRFFFDGSLLVEAGSNLSEFDGKVTGQILIDRNVAGEFPFFSGPCQSRGSIPDWFLNPLTETRTPANIHFSKINEFGYGDVKAIWELNRFGFVFDLARAFARTGDERCGQRFWELFDNWLDCNPPYQGINWKCGQESGLRMLAVVFGYFSFRHHSSFTGAEASKLMAFLAATGLRIERHISYAISQKNNHGISEAVALWTLGVLFPNLKRAVTWRQRGEEVLAQLCDELIYDDGGFSQHSANYHRLLLHLLAWCVQLAKINEIDLPAPVVARFNAATRFLFQCLDQESGLVPRFGQDDGALLFPLNSCQYQDFRPVINLCFAVLRESKQFEPGPWDEDLFWFGLDRIDESEENARERQDPTINMTTAGCHVIRSQRSSAFILAGRFVHRPGHMDMLHVDIWAGGNNVALDAGTYSYNGPGIWKNIPLSRSPCHNSITVDGKPLAKRVSKFLSVPWPESEFVSQTESPDYCVMVFRREMRFELKDTVIHWRAVCRLPNESWMVLDRIHGKREHNYRLHWLLGGKVTADTLPNEVSMSFDNGFEYHLTTNCSGKSQTIQTTESQESALGYYAPRYFDLAPALSYAVQTKSRVALFGSFFGPDKRMLQRFAELTDQTGTGGTTDFQGHALGIIGKLVNESLARSAGQE